MGLPRSILLAALCLAPLAHADDWLAGEYEMSVPDHPAPSRFMMTITKDAGGGYRAEAFEEAVDPATGKTSLTRARWSGSAESSGVEVIAPAEMISSGVSAAEAAGVHCADVDGMVLCKIDDGASLSLDGRTLHAGYFASAMHVGLIEVRKLPPRDAHAAASAGDGGRP